MHLLVCLLLCIPGRIAAQVPSAEREFLAKVQKAFDQKNVSAYLSLYCWDRVDQKTRETFTADAVETVSNRLAKVELAALEDDDVASLGAYTLEGVTYRPNLKPLKKLVLNFRPLDGDGNGVAGSELPVGMKNGAFMIVAPALSTNTPAKSEYAESWRKAQRVMIQTINGTLTPPALEMVARKYLDDHRIVVDDGEPILAIYVGDTNRMALVQFLQGTNGIRAVEIGLSGKAVKDHLIPIAHQE